MHKQPAQMIVEFALIAPVLIVLALGILGFGRAFYSYIDLTNAARAGARYATATAPACDTSAIKSAVQAAQGGLSIPLGSITPTCFTDRRTVAIAYSFDTMAPFLGTITLSTSATLPLVNQ